MFRLNINILKKKIKIIKKIKFSRILRELTIVLKFFDYYRKFVLNYAIVVKLFIALKIKNFKNNFIKEQFKRRYVEKIIINKKLTFENVLFNSKQNKNY